MWSCHTLRNELLGTASVSLWNLLKSGGKCMSACMAWPELLWVPWPLCGVCVPAEGQGLPTPQEWPQQGTRHCCVLGDSSQICVSRGARAVWKHKPSAICCYLLPFVVTGVWLWQQLLHKDTHSRLSHGSCCAGLEKAYSVFSKQSSASHRTQSWYGEGGREEPLPSGEWGVLGLCQAYMGLFLGTATVGDKVPAVSPQCSLGQACPVPLGLGIAASLLGTHGKLVCCSRAVKPVRTWLVPGGTGLGCWSCLCWGLSPVVLSPTFSQSRATAPALPARSCGRAQSALSLVGVPGGCVEIEWKRQLAVLVHSLTCGRKNVSDFSLTPWARREDS